MATQDDDQQVGDQAGDRGRPTTGALEPGVGGQGGRGRLLTLVLSIVVAVATAVGAVVGQGIAYRQMRAIEDIAKRCTQ